jgi:hypothetical protein
MQQEVLEDYRWALQDYTLMVCNGVKAEQPPRPPILDWVL